MPRAALATALALLLALAALPAAAGQPEPARWEFDPPHCTILFKVRHILVEVPGRFGRFDGEILFDPANLAASRVEVAIQAASIDTGVAKRDQHLRSADFLDAERHPEIRFVSREILHRGGRHYLARGELTLRGRTRPVDLAFVFYGAQPAPRRQGVTVGGFRASHRLDRLAYGVGDGQWHRMGVLGREVSLELHLELIRRPPGPGPRAAGTD